MPTAQSSAPNAYTQPEDSHTRRIIEIESRHLNHKYVPRKKRNAASTDQRYSSVAGSYLSHEPDGVEAAHNAYVSKLPVKKRSEHLSSNPTAHTRVFRPQSSSISSNSNRKNGGSMGPSFSEGYKEEFD